MIFGQEMIEKIVNGEKKVTRRVTIGRYRVGGVYSVQPGRGKKGVAKIRITDIRLETVGDINRREAILEGFNTDNPVRDFFSYWKKLHKRNNIDLQEKVWRIEFELIGGD